MANNFLQNGLLGFGGFGLGGNNMPTNSLLGDYYDPAEMRKYQMKQMLLGLGAGLMAEKGFGKGAALALAAGDRAGTVYRDNAMDAYKIKTAQEERDYQRGRDAKVDERADREYKLRVDQYNREKAWNNYLQGRQTEADATADQQKQAQQDYVTGFMGDQTQQGASLPFSPGVRSIARQGGLAGPSATDQWRFDNARPYVGAQDYGSAFQQITAQPPAPKDPISVGKGSRLYDTNTKTFIETPGGASDDPAIDDPLKISKDYQNQPGFQRLKEVAPTVNSMVKSLDDPSAMADLDFVYGLAKILDPTSVVRESEAGMVIDSQGIAPSLLGQLNKIMTGEQAMLPETRRKLVAVALRRANEFKAQAEQERGFYGNMAKESGYNPDTYLQAVPAIPGIPTDEEGWQTLPNGTRIRQKGN